MKSNKIYKSLLNYGYRDFAKSYCQITGNYEVLSEINKLDASLNDIEKDIKNIRKSKDIEEVKEDTKNLLVKIDKNIKQSEKLGDSKIKILLNKIKEKLKSILKSNTFKTVISVLIFVSMLLIACKKHRKNKILKDYYYPKIDMYVMNYTEFKTLKNLGVI